MKKNLVLLLSVVVSAHAMAQVDPVGAYNRFMTENWSGQYTRVGQNKVKGSPHLFGKSFPGQIDYGNGMFITKEKVLYNLLDQKAGPDVNGEIFEADKKPTQFILDLPRESGGKRLFRHSSTYGDEKLNIYLNVVTDGAYIALLKAYKIKMTPDPTNMMDKEAKIFEQYVEYYVFLHGDPGTLQKIKLRKKDIMEVLSKIKGGAEKAANSTGDFSNEDDMQVLFSSINR
ncbi:MAG: hypothetical protein MUF24_09055 [Chitinophagaceae bacterium]|nr:hypothetical protein [Chitinophagaceae bacterium]